MVRRAGNVVIASGQSLSPSVDIGGTYLVGIYIAGWTAADLTFQVSFDGGATFVNVYDINDNEYTVQAGADRMILFKSNEIIPAIGLFKFRSGTAAAPVNQGAARTIIPLVV